MITGRHRNWWLPGVLLFGVNFVILPLWTNWILSLIYESSPQDRHWSSHVRIRRDIGSQLGTQPALTTFPDEIRSETGRSDSVYNVASFGAKGDGVSDDRPAIQATINHALEFGGAVFFPVGNYRIGSKTSADDKANGIVIPYSGSYGSHGRRVVLRGAGPGTRLMAAAPGMIILRISNSFCTVENMSVDGNGFQEVYGVAVVPESMVQASRLANQNFNAIRSLYIVNCSEGMVMQAGPRVAGVDSGCWYNYFTHLVVRGCTRGLWLKDGPNRGASGSNRNTFVACRFGEAPANTGIQIDAGDTNKFIACAFEGIQSGTSPNRIPTAIKIGRAAPTTGAECHHNVFIGVELEACARTVENDHGKTEFWGGAWNMGELAGRCRPIIYQAEVDGITKNYLGDEAHAGLIATTSGIELSDQGFPNRSAMIQSTAGASETYNGVAVSSNMKRNGEGGNAALPSHRLDIGGFDGSTSPDSRDSTTFSRRGPGAWEWTAYFRANANGTYLGGRVAFDTQGFGSPEGVVVAPVGSTYRRIDGAGGTSFYVKEHGSDATGWRAK